jgi:hypothetical protein
MKSGLSGNRVSYLLLSIAFLIPLARVYWPGGSGLDVTGHPIGRDFINLWAAPQLAFSGRLSFLFDLHAYQVAIGEMFGHPLPDHIWSYPPTALLISWPLTLMPYFGALAVWTFGTFAVFAAIVVSQVPPERRCFALLSLALAPACLINSIGGQNGFLTAALLIGAVLSLDRRPILAGFLFGLLTFKPHLGLAVPFALLALGAWRVVIAAFVTTVLFVAASVAVLGAEVWPRFLVETGSYQLIIISNFEGFYTYMMASVLAAGRTFGLSYQAALAVQIAVAVVVLASACWAIRQTADPVCRVAVLATATPLVTPYAFNYDLTAVAAVLVWRLVGVFPSDRKWDFTCLLAWLAPTAMMPLNALGLGLTPFLQGAIFWMVIASIRSETGTSRDPAPAS